mmetsp:Transcript_41482/g.133873  ORF Transcript_41482/g.133873 Transcript_41482/m.133873 type:complete len:284 (+) Transcript_41482:70-921(+)
MLKPGLVCTSCCRLPPRLTVLSLSCSGVMSSLLASFSLKFSRSKGGGPSKLPSIVMVMTEEAVLPPLCEEEEDGPADELATGNVAPAPPPPPMLSKTSRSGCMLSRRAVGLALPRSSSRTWPAFTAKARVSSSFALSFEFWASRSERWALSSWSDLLRASSSCTCERCCSAAAAARSSATPAFVRSATASVWSTFSSITCSRAASACSSCACRVSSRSGSWSSPSLRSGPSAISRQLSGSAEQSIATPLASDATSSLMSPASALRSAICAAVCRYISYTRRRS